MDIVVAIEHQKAGSALTGGGQGRGNNLPVDILTISFTALDGRPYTFVNDFGVTSNVFSIDDKIAIAYEKDNPNTAHVSQPGNVTLWAFDAFYLLASLFCFFCCWVCLRANRA